MPTQTQILVNLVHTNNQSTADTLHDLTNECFCGEITNLTNDADALIELTGYCEDHEHFEIDITIMSMADEDGEQLTFDISGNADDIREQMNNIHEVIPERIAEMHG